MALEPPRSLWMEGYNYNEDCNQISDLYYLRTLKVISQCQCRSAPGAFSADKTPTSLSFLLPSSMKGVENKRSSGKTAEGWKGGQGRWEWEERKGMGVWNSVEKAGAVMWARKRDTQSVCHCNGGRFDTRASAVPVSIGRSFHYQSTPISHPPSVLAIQARLRVSVCQRSPEFWLVEREHLMLHDWLL